MSLTILKINYRGTVHPRRLPTNYTEQTLVIGYVDSPGRLSLSYYIDKNDIYATAEFDEQMMAGEYADYSSLSGIVKESIQSKLNIGNVVNGTYCVAEIEYFEIDDEWKSVDLVIPVIYYFEDNKEEKFSKIEECIRHSHVAQIYFHKILSDFNLAMKYPQDTGFFCYRAIELMAKYFCHSMTSSMKPKHTTLLLKHINVDRRDFDLIKNNADPVRHGGTIPIPSTLRADIFSASWRFLDGFVDFCLRDFDGVESSVVKDQKRQ